MAASLSGSTADAADLAFARAWPWLDTGAGTPADAPGHRVDPPGVDREVAKEARLQRIELRGVGTRVRARALTDRPGVPRLVGIGIATYAELTGIGSRISAAPGMPINTGTEAATIRLDSKLAVCGIRKQIVETGVRRAIGGARPHSAAMSGSPDRSTGVPRALAKAGGVRSSAGPVSRSAGGFDREPRLRRPDAPSRPTTLTPPVRSRSAAHARPPGAARPVPG
jgi:hypothetical protein